mmetsp:Transcript_48394/g.158344  ORF Transcript_48394/g.158344 Transcript_48394/m.158344 type:complete len:332 (-) Transcript_48394:233-1228(-)
MDVWRRAFVSAASSSVRFETVDVFSSHKFGGNQLAVVLDEQRRLSDDDMRRIAIEFGFSETTIVLPPKSEANTAWVRIFSKDGDEMPFAGHPNVGTATVLAWRRSIFGKEVRGTVLLEEKAGLVPLELIEDEAGRPVGATLTAPEPFSLSSPPLPAEAAAALIGLEANDVCAARHPPLAASTGLPFLLVELSSLAALGRSRGVPSAFEALAAGGAATLLPPKVLAYVRLDGSGGGEAARLELRARMHRADGSEDAGTGSANCALAGLLASLDGTPPGLVRARVMQGVEMGRPSELLAEAERKGAGAGAEAVGRVRVGGMCAAVSRGELLGW